MSQAKRPDSKPHGPAKDFERIGVIDLTSEEELTEVEVAMNNNELLRCQPEGIESQVLTKLVVWECGARLIEFE